MPKGWCCRFQFLFIYILGRFLLALHAVTVLLEYLTDCSIRVSRIFFFWGGGGGHVSPLDPPLLSLVRCHCTNFGPIQWCSVGTTMSYDQNCKGPDAYSYCCVCRAAKLGEGNWPGVLFPGSSGSGLERLILIHYKNHSTCMQKSYTASGGCFPDPLKFYISELLELAELLLTSYVLICNFS